MKIKSVKKVSCCPPSATDCCPPKAVQPSQSSCCPPPATPSCGAPAETNSCCPAPAEVTTDKPPCCGPATTRTGGEITDKVPGFLHWLSTKAGRVPQISTSLTFRDHFGACKARWALHRMDFIVPPGLYAIGTPNADSAVVVTCNYQMTYDIVRSELKERNVWLLVLETHGVNVWCAAGKGTFGTDELIRQVKRSGLSEVVSHRRLLLPILGAPGIAAHKVAAATGFNITYATIRAEDLPAFLDNGQTTTPEMRQLTFTFYERLTLVPVEFVMALRSALAVTVGLFLLGWLCSGLSGAVTLSLAFFGAMLAGVAVGPTLLPWLPGRSFAVKGATVGLLWTVLWYQLAGGAAWGILETGAAILALPAASAFYTLNFTGCSTYTSRTGVKREMRLSMPVMGGAVVLSALLLLVSRFI